MSLSAKGKKNEPSLPKIEMENYRSWSFRDRSFAFALLLSVAWHFFWFFSLTIVVSAPRKPDKTKPRMVSLGPVLDDTLFRTLVETRPELTQTFYRNNLEEIAQPPLEMPAQALQKHQPGDVVSVPFSRRFLTSLRDLIGGIKTAPESDIRPRISDVLHDEVYSVEGDIKNRPLVFKPELSSVIQNQDFTLKIMKLEFDVEVDKNGNVIAADFASTGDNLSTDSNWLQYVRQWRFAPVADEPILAQKGRIKIVITPLPRKTV